MDKEILENEKYSFLRENPLFKDRIILLVAAGSHAYGTNNEDSDIDIRGVFLEDIKVSLGFTQYEQYMDNQTDTVMYTLKKFLKLIKDSNPTAIEMLNARDEDYLYISPIGKILIENRNMFLSKSAVDTLFGYANMQLNRILNYLARRTIDSKEGQEIINGSVTNAKNAILSSMKLPIDSINTYVDDNAQILVDFNAKGLPLIQLHKLIRSMTTIINQYKIGLNAVNRKKDEKHMYKHIMHMFRLYYMSIELLKTESVSTYRENEHELLMDIRTGKFRTIDGAISPKLIELNERIKKEINMLKQTSPLRERIDEKFFNELAIRLYRMVI